MAHEDRKRRRELFGSTSIPQRRNKRQHISIEAELLFHLAQCGLDGVFAGLEMAARRKPGADLPVPVKSDAAFVDYEAGNGEVPVHADIVRANQQICGPATRGPGGPGTPALPARSP